MTRAGHSTAALAVGFIGVCIDPTLHGLALAIGLVGGANLPDDLEFPLRSADGRGPTLVPHRSLTHWPWSYGAIAAAAWLLPFPFDALVAGAALGALIHLAIDACSPHGIPWVNPLRPVRPTRALYRTWSASEWNILAPLLMVAIGAGIAQHAALDVFLASLPTLISSHLWH